MNHDMVFVLKINQQLNYLNEKMWFRRLDGIALFLFSMGTCFLTGYNQLRMVGIFMVLSFLIINAGKLIRDHNYLRPVPPELKFYTLWVLWVFLTGPLVATDLDYFWAGGRVLAQMFVMVWVTYGILWATRNGEDAVFLGILLGGLVEIIFVVTNVHGFGELIQNTRAPERIMGMTNNPNSLGFLMVWFTVCSLIYWHIFKKRMLWQILLFVLIGFAAYVLLASGSRKSSIAFVFVLWAWVTFAVTEGIGKGARKVVVSIILGGLALWLFSTYGMQLAANTPVGVRWQKFMVQGGGSITMGIEHQSRYEMYVQGIQIFFQNPIFGVGLNNFGKYFYTGQYSHSDYIEPLATTGLVGFILYQAFYIILFLRLKRLLRIVEDPIIRYKLKMMLIGLGAILIIGFGAPHYTDQTVFLLLVASSVYTWDLQRNA